MYPKLDSSRAAPMRSRRSSGCRLACELERDIERQHRLATLGTIAGLIAHEFNNILTPMLSYAQMAAARPRTPTWRARAAGTVFAAAAERGPDRLGDP